MNILGIHGGITINQHEPAAALIINGDVIAICEEERYLRVKSSYGYLPYHAIKACLEIGQIKPEDIDLVVSTGCTYDNFEEHLSKFIYHSFGIKKKLKLVHHQEAHLAASFYGSGYDESLCLSLDATGDGSSGFVGHATRDKGIEVLEEIPTTNSLGFFYTMMTHYLGYNDGDEYKVMGLAPYGKPNIDLSKIIYPIDKGWAFDWSFIQSNPSCQSPFQPLYSKKLIDLLGKSNRNPSQSLDDFYKDIACSTQKTMENCFLNLVTYYHNQMPEVKNFCYSGGVALNCVANGKLFDLNIFDSMYISPVASDRGLALGCAYLGSIESGDTPQPLAHPYQGTEFTDAQIEQELLSNGIDFMKTEDPSKIAAELIADGKIIGWFQGRSECGARALGNRSILANASENGMKDKVNAKIKYREEFRPFAPSILLEDSNTYFGNRDTPTPYMSLTFNCNKEKAQDIESVVHVNQTSRIQTVSATDNPKYYSLIDHFKSLTGIPLILNTSFNLKGQPIVDSPRDALMTFFGCGLDALFLGKFLIKKTNGHCL
jgi:carbamoyltransferase